MKLTIDCVACGNRGPHALSAVARGACGRSGDAAQRLHGAHRGLEFPLSLTAEEDVTEKCEERSNLELPRAHIQHSVTSAEKSSKGSKGGSAPTSPRPTHTSTTAAPTYMPF